MPGDEGPTGVPGPKGPKGKPVSFNISYLAIIKNGVSYRLLMVLMVQRVRKELLVSLDQRAKRLKQTSLKS